MKTFKLLPNLLFPLLLLIMYAGTLSASPFQSPKALPIVVLDYQGYRLHIANLKLLERKEDWIKISFTAINTGRENIHLGLNKVIPLVINFDHDFKQSGLSDYKLAIQKNIISELLTVKAGEIKDNIERQISIKNTAPADTETIASTESNKTTPKKEVRVKEKSKNKTASTKSTKLDIINATEKEAKDKRIDKIESKEKTVRETTKVDRINTPEEQPVKEEKQEVLSIMNPQAAKEVKKVVKKEKPKRKFLDKNNCPDLAIDEIRIIKKSKRWLMLEYTITNHGSSPANLYGDEKGDQDNVAIRANLSGTTKLTRGSIILGGDFVTNAKNKGMLEVGKSYKGLMKLDISDMSRYTPVLILELDIYQTVRECDETNNRKHMQLK